jgi:hypothetical protein
MTDFPQTVSLESVFSHVHPWLKCSRVFVPWCLGGKTRPRFNHAVLHFICPGFPAVMARTQGALGLLQEIKSIVATSVAGSGLSIAVTVKRNGSFLPGVNVPPCQPALERAPVGPRAFRLRLTFQ